MPKSRSIESLQAAAMEDVEHTRQIVKQLSAELNLKNEIKVETDKFSNDRPVHISINRTTIRGRPIVTRNKNINELGNVAVYESIERALIDMNNISRPSLNNNQRAIRALSSMGIATSVSINRSSAARLERSTTKEKFITNSLKKIELDETIADQEYTKPSPQITGLPTDTAKLAKLNVKQNQYLQRISGRMCKLWNTGQKGYPNVYSTYRPFVSAGKGIASKPYNKNSTKKGGRVIEDPRVRLLVTSRKAASTGGLPGAPNMPRGVSNILSSAGTTTPDEVASSPNQPSITSGNTTY